MTVEERIFKCSNEGRGTRHALGLQVVKPREKSQKRKHLVAAALANSGLSSDCHAAKDTQPTHWIVKFMALVAILVSTWFVQKSQNPSDSHGAIGVGESPSTLVPSATEILPQSYTFPCSGHGYLIRGGDGSTGTCKCHACHGGADCSEVVTTCIIDLDHGDPTMFEDYWLKNGASSTTVIAGWQRMSYFAHNKHVWFMEHELDQQIRSLHQLVGNAVTEGRHIVVGTGSTQLFQATLYALTSPDQPKPTSVVSAAPFYSSYPAVTDYLRSALFKWGGDAAKFQPVSESDPYIELVTSPNNPDGKIQQAIVNGTGPVVYDLAYYWPHYTPITEQIDQDIMLFTVSKSTGHAGTRIGWAILKDEKVAKKMMKFIELNTIGVSQDSQVRATHIIKAIVEGYASTPGRVSGQQSSNWDDTEQHTKNAHLFHHGYSVMQYRWNRLRSAVASSSSFTIPDFAPDHCNFFGEETTPTPAFAWLHCTKVADCQAFLKERGIITRSGRFFGAGPEYVRLSMLERSQSFELLVDRLARMDSARTPD